MRKYIVGRIAFKPGTRDEYFALIRPLIEATQAEQGCLLYEHSPHPYDPDVVFVMECFTGEAAHAAHLKTAHFKAAWALIERLGNHASVENIFADRVVPDTARFGPSGP